MSKHQRQSSVPAQPTYEEPVEVTAAPVATSFWTNHPTFSSLLYDIMLWVRPYVTAGTYIALVWLYFIIRAIIPDSTTSTIIVIVFALITTMIMIAGKTVMEVINAVGILHWLDWAPDLLIAAPRDDENKMDRANKVDCAFKDTNSRLNIFLSELGLAAPESEGGSLTLIGKCVLGTLCVLLAFFLSMFETRTLVITFLLIFVAIPPSIHYDLPMRVLDALSTASSKNATEDAPSNGATADDAPAN